MGDQRDRMLRGDPYLDSDDELVAERAVCHLLTEQFNAAPETERRGHENYVATPV